MSSKKSELIIDFIKNKIKNNNDLNILLNKYSEKEPIANKVLLPIANEVKVKESSTTEDKDSTNFNEPTASKPEINLSRRGFIYELIWDLCIKFGVVDNLTLKNIDKIKQTSHFFDNANNPEVNIDFDPNYWNTNFNKYINSNIISGNSGGYSDITFINKNYSKEDEKYENNETLFLISVKFFENEKTIDKYDIGKLCTLIEKHSNSNRKIKMLLFVNDKERTIKIFNKQHKSSEIMIKYINPGGQFENIYDKTDLIKYYNKLRDVLELYNFLEKDSDIEDFKTEYLSTLKDVFIPRFHQKLMISKINNLLNSEPPEKNILVGAIPRSGKSYIMAGSILEFIKNSKKEENNFLLITPAPNETFPEYEKIFNDYIEFSDINVVSQNTNTNKGKIEGYKKKKK